MIRSAGILLAATLLCACGNPSECSIGAERCVNNTPQHCIQSPTLSEGVGLWVDGTSCNSSGQVCQVDQGGKAVCVAP